MRTEVGAAAGLALALAMIVAGPALGASNRVWVSGHGADAAGCGAPTAPCRSLQYAHDHAVAAGGEIDILDPAGYGAITITKAVSIVNDGVGTAGVQASSGAAITIGAAASGSVYLRGLNVDGVQFAGSYGVDDQSAGILTIDGCVFRHFAVYGIFLEPAAGLPKINISNTTASDNFLDGIAYLPTVATAAQLAIDNAAVNNNAGGVAFNISNGNLAVSITNSLISNSGGGDVTGPGIFVSSGSIVATIDSSRILLNSGDGLVVQNAAVHLSRSVVNLNGGFAVNHAPMSAGTIFTTGDNRFSGNLAGDLNGPPLTPESTN